ncbi:hypothetical protein CSOJ01_03669 [Colletotrichum sojae]|uniref:Uncharacterized protein n=1 Tax=Colletotrichum sojae TaxID=2175907 RepID=A0A8H6JL99_9PEZI|nr:hypothetical protein CSOJ01_03669 [Colletotrichum sojae]
MNPTTALLLFFASVAVAVPNLSKNNVEAREALPQRGGGGTPSPNPCGQIPRPPGC